MKTMKISLVILYFLVSLQVAAEPADTLAWQYFGQTPPGKESQRFHGGHLVEHENGDIRSFNIAMSPDGTEMFFSYYKGPDAPIYEIRTFKYADNEWIGPVTAPFSGVHEDVDINFSPDGNTVFFASDRPQPHSKELDIYYATRTPDGWSEPIYAGTEVNSLESEVYPSLSVKDHLFFRSQRPGGHSESDLYRADFKHGNFTNVINLGPNVNSPYGQSNAVIARDESYILFCSARPETNSVQYIYVAFQTGDNVWTKAVPLGAQVNTPAGAGAPTLSPDGNYLFFKKSKAPHRGLYWVSTKIIDELRRELLP